MRTRRRKRSSGRRLGVYIDTVYRRDGARPDRLLTNSELIPFMHFVCEVGAHADSLVMFGRDDPGDRGADFEVPGEAGFVALPFYANLVRGWEVLRAAPGTVVAMWRGLARVDAVVVFGPYPFSLFLVLFGLARGKRVVLGVRQDTMRYFRSRLPHPLAAPVLAPLWLIDRAYRLLSRRLPTFVVGGLLERQYGGPRPGLAAIRPSLVRAEDVVSEPPTKDWSGPLELLTVGRIEPEKNPLLLVEALAELERAQPGRFRLRWIGEGRMKEAARERARELGVDGSISWAGFVPFGPQLLGFYQRAHVFVHVATTEAFGQVLAESMACGLPIVATDVGGVSSALDGGRAGLLVPPSRVGPLVAAIQRLSDDPDLRQRCVDHGLALARRHTLEAEARRVAVLALGSGDPA
ncbi:MAG TPA: glycosyltransferase family 4 protein [Solirubrobacterales bacterium]|nr:glycosyltransferase family 4 protein [Solirubrobacterales bacterium]